MSNLDDLITRREAMHLIHKLASKNIPRKAISKLVYDIPAVIIKEEEQCPITNLNIGTD